MMPVFEVRASTGHRIFVEADETGVAVQIARQRWARFGIVPRGVEATIPPTTYVTRKEQTR